MNAICRIVNSDAAVDFHPSPFFAEQLTAFELWLQHGSKDKKPPEQLPIVLQVSSTACIPHSALPEQAIQNSSSKRLFLSEFLETIWMLRPSENLNTHLPDSLCL